jgi:hypothetical protein
MVRHELFFKVFEYLVTFGTCLLPHKSYNGPVTYHAVFAADRYAVIVLSTVVSNLKMPIEVNCRFASKEGRHFN